MAGRRRTIAVLLAVLTTLLLPAPSQAAGITATPIATGLDFPAAFTVFPDAKRLLYGERFTGRIRIFNMERGFHSPFFTVPNIAATGEQGLLGLALHPNYPNVRYVYAYVSRQLSGGVENQIVRITESGGKGTDMRVIFRSPASSTHNGGRIAFGPDGNLYAVIGDGGSPSNSQDLSATTGKVLRMTPAGGIPGNNPFPGRYAFAYGIRNSFGMAFDPQTGRLWETDNGPTCNDEVNRIARGRNYGWGPSWTCSTPPQPPANTNQDGPSPVLPIRWYGQSTAPTGIVFCQGCALGAESEGDVFFGEFNTSRIRRADLGPQRWSLGAQSVVYTHSRKVLSMERASDGRIYFSDTGGLHRLTLA